MTTPLRFLGFAALAAALLSSAHAAVTAVTASFAGDGGHAIEATLSGPKGIAVAPSGNVYLADTESHCVRMVDVKNGTLELICGTSGRGDGPDGDPLKCQLARLHGLRVDRDGSVFISDSEARRVRVIRP